MSMRSRIHPTSFIGIPVDVEKSAFAMSIAVGPVSYVLCSVLPLHCSFSMSETCQPLSIVNCFRNLVLVRWKSHHFFFSLHRLFLQSFFYVFWQEILRSYLCKLLLSLTLPPRFDSSQVSLQLYYRLQILRIPLEVFLITC